MKKYDILPDLVATLDDLRLSRTERRAMQLALEDLQPNESARVALIAALFDAARARTRHPDDRQVLQWLEDCIKVLRPLHQHPSHNQKSRAFFAPYDHLAGVLASLIRSTRKSLDAAVFTITDDRIYEALVEVHRRGVKLRVLTDNQKADDRGSDIWRLRRAGVPVATDRSPAWMHHKFAILDGRSLINGSYNWTRAASEENLENFLLTSDPDLVRAYQAAFDRMWAEFGDSAE